MIALFGLHMTGVIRIPFLGREYRRMMPAGSELLDSFALGLAFAADWTPCVGPILGSILLLAATEGSAVRGGMFPGLYSLGTTVLLWCCSAWCFVGRRAGWDGGRGWLE